VNFVADENMARQIVERLRLQGHTVVWVVEVARGDNDVDVLALANSHNAILITDDKDFGELVVRQRRPVLGVMLLRLEGMAPDDRAELVARVIDTNAASLPGAFTVVQRNAVRVRRLQP
jgi:predicted nuclease of predicted toxin-antitoxin system